jgi:hypothetical protein
MFTKEEILSQFDACAKASVFPGFDEREFVYAGSRLTAYRNVQHWSVIVEQVGVIPGLAGHEGIVTRLFCFGNCLNDAIGVDDRYVYHMTRDGMEGPTFVDVPEGVVHPQAMTLRLRGKPIWIERNPIVLESSGVVRVSTDRLFSFELVRTLFLEYRHKMLLHDVERSELMWADPPRFLQLNEWYQPTEGLPGECETFQLLAEALVEGDIGIYEPTCAPNTHWSQVEGLS